MPHEDPLAYVLGIEGLALLRGFAGETDAAFARDRIDEVRRLIDDPALAGGVDVEQLDVADGYRLWARTYDAADNPAFADERVVSRILATLAPGTALDAACGTGRLSALLHEAGNWVIGVDASVDMLDHARRRVPAGEFRSGALDALPVADRSIDVVVCGLALTHVKDLDAAFAEFARVLRPGGSLITTDLHPDQVALGSVPLVRTAEGHPARIATIHHPVGDYLRAALAHGFDIRLFEETRPTSVPDDLPTNNPVPAEPGPWDTWPWSLRDVVPTASAAVFRHVPDLLILHLVKRAGDAAPH